MGIYGLLVMELGENDRAAYWSMWGFVFASVVMFWSIRKWAALPDPIFRIDEHGLTDFRTEKTIPWDHIVDADVLFVYSRLPVLKIAGMTDIRILSEHYQDYSDHPLTNVAKKVQPGKPLAYPIEAGITQLGPWKFAAMIRAGLGEHRPETEDNNVDELNILTISPTDQN